MLNPETANQLQYSLGNNLSPSYSWGLFLKMSLNNRNVKIGTEVDFERGNK